MRKREAFVDFVEAQNTLFLVMVTALAMLIRLKFFPHASSDYYEFLQGWFNTIRFNGGFAAVGQNFGDYTPPYYYILALLSYIPGRDLYLIKAFSCLTDVLMAYGVLRIVRLKYDEFWGEIAYAITLFLPSVVINSSVWAQCDSIYTALLLACLYYLLTDRPNRAVLAYSIAFTFKLQSIFLAPFLLLLLLKQKIKWRSVLILPITYLVLILPAVLMGGNLWDLLTVYVRQTGEYQQLSLNFPNLYIWFPQDAPGYIGKIAVLFAGAVVLGTLIFLWRKKFTLSNNMIVSLSLFYLMLVPYFLPYMHDRYYYPADLFSLVFAFYYPEKFYVPIITVLSSTYAALRFLFGIHFINLKVFSVMMLFNLIWVGIQIVYRIRDDADGKAAQVWME